MRLPVIDCTDCGACCRGQDAPPLYVYIAAVYADGDPAEFAELERSPVYAEDAVRFRALPPALKRELVTYWWDGGELYDGRADCFWLDPDTLRCRNYEHRPSVCREFVLGGPECLACRDERRPANAAGLPTPGA